MQLVKANQQLLLQAAAVCSERLIDQTRFAQHLVAIKI